jgi:hypothetical protein
MAIGVTEDFFYRKWRKRWKLLLPIMRIDQPRDFRSSGAPRYNKSTYQDCFTLWSVRHRLYILNAVVQEPQSFNFQNISFHILNKTTITTLIHILVNEFSSTESYLSVHYKFKCFNSGTEQFYYCLFLADLQLPNTGLCQYQFIDTL